MHRESRVARVSLADCRWGRKCKGVPLAYQDASRCVKMCNGEPSPVEALDQVHELSDERRVARREVVALRGVIDDVEHLLSGGKLRLSARVTAGNGMGSYG